MSLMARIFVCTERIERPFYDCNNPLHSLPLAPPTNYPCYKSRYVMAHNPATLGCMAREVNNLFYRTWEPHKHCVTYLEKYTLFHILKDFKIASFIRKLLRFYQTRQIGCSSQGRHFCLGRPAYGALWWSCIRWVCCQPGYPV